MDAAQRLCFDDQEIRGAGASDRERIVGLADALVGRDGDVHIGGATTDLGELVDGRARLLDILEIEGGEGVDGVLGLIHVP